MGSWCRGLVPALDGLGIWGQLGVPGKAESFKGVPVVLPQVLVLTCLPSLLGSGWA